MVISCKMDTCHQETKYLDNMVFGITQDIDAEAESKSVLINSLSSLLKSYFSNKEYGKGIEHFFIGVICVKYRPGYEDWFKVRKPKYKVVDKIKMPDGRVNELQGVYSYDIKLDFERFVNSSDDESEKLLASEILNSLSHLDALPKKVKDFDKERFKADMEAFFKEQIK